MMDRIGEMKAFIRNVEDKFKDEIIKLEIRNRERERERQKRCNCINSPRFREHSSDLTDKEKEDIRQFYMKCPSGYEVDHIIPLSKGGKHHITNLQYLTKKQNMAKGTKLDWTDQPEPIHESVKWCCELKCFVTDLK